MYRNKNGKLKKVKGFKCSSVTKQRVSMLIEAYFTICKIGGDVYGWLNRCSGDTFITNKGMRKIRKYLQKVCSEEGDSVIENFMTCVEPGKTVFSKYVLSDMIRLRDWFVVALPAEVVARCRMEYEVPGSNQMVVVKTDVALAVDIWNAFFSTSVMTVLNPSFTTKSRPKTLLGSDIFVNDKMVTHLKKNEHHITNPIASMLAKNDTFLYPHQCRERFNECISNTAYMWNCYIQLGLPQLVPRAETATASQQLETRTEQ
jgi:hypothetical protein